MRCRARALPRFDLRDVLPAVAADVAQFVEFRMKAVADRSTVRQIDGRLIGDRVEDARVDIFDGIEPRRRYR